MDCGFGVVSAEFFRCALSGGSAKIELTGGSGVELGGTSRPELQLLPLKGKVKQLAKLTEHPLMDDELERLRRESVAKAFEGLDLTVSKVVDAAVAKVRAQGEPLDPAQRAAQVTTLAEGWEKAQRKLDKELAWMGKIMDQSEPWLREIADPTLLSIWSLREHEAQAQRLHKTIATGRAALYRDAALTLADSAPARNRSLSNLYGPTQGS